MRTPIIILLPPKSNLFPSVFQGKKPVLIQTFFPQPAVEGLDKCVIRGLPGSAEIQFHAIQVSPLIQYFTDTLRTFGKLNLRKRRGNNLVFYADNLL
jgi:hypothetical protein